MSDHTKKIAISPELENELKKIQSSCNNWTTLNLSMESVIKMLVEYYYLLIGFPESKWKFKIDKQEIEEMKKIIERRNTQ